MLKYRWKGRTAGRHNDHFYGDLHNREGYYEADIPDMSTAHRYRVKILYEGNEFVSPYMEPLETPEIDELSFDKRAPRDSVSVNISSYTLSDDSRYYMWSYEEIYEVISPVYLETIWEADGSSTCRQVNDTTAQICIWPERYDSIDGPYNTYQHCWVYDGMDSIMLEHMPGDSVDGVNDRTLFRISPFDIRIKDVYYLKVKQNLVRKEYFDYFRHTARTSDYENELFSPVPSEMRSNIRCTTDPSIPVAGFAEVSMTAEKEILMEAPIEFYEAPPPRDCSPIDIDANYFFKALECTQIFPVYISPPPMPDKYQDYNLIPAGLLFDGIVDPEYFYDYYQLYDTVSVRKLVTVEEENKEEKDRCMEIEDGGEVICRDGICEEYRWRLYFRYIPAACVNCYVYGGTKNKPDFWPNDHK